MNKEQFYKKKMKEFDDEFSIPVKPELKDKRAGQIQSLLNGSFDIDEAVEDNREKMEELNYIGYKDHYERIREFIKNYHKELIKLLKNKTL